MDRIPVAKAGGDLIWQGYSVVTILCSTPYMPRCLLSIHAVIREKLILDTLINTANKAEPQKQRGVIVGHNVKLENRLLS